MWELCMQIFRPLALLVWEENEVADAHMMSSQMFDQDWVESIFCGSSKVGSAIYGLGKEEFCRGTSHTLHPNILDIFKKFLSRSWSIWTQSAKSYGQKTQFAQLTFIHFFLGTKCHEKQILLNTIRDTAARISGIFLTCKALPFLDLGIHPEDLEILWWTKNCLIIHIRFTIWCRFQ